MWTRRRVLVGSAATAAALALPGRSFAATDQLTVALRHEPPHLDPVAGSDPATLAVSYQNLFEGLTRIDERGAVQPGLAKSWIPAADGRSLDFKLEAEVRYHDGTSFDAGHVVFSLKRLLGGNAPARAAYAAIADVIALDEGTVRLVLGRADDQLLHKLGLPAASIVAPESADNNGAVPIGTGPFAFVEWDMGERVLLARNEDYWGPHPRLNEAVFVFIGDAVAGAEALSGHDIDGFPDFPAGAALPLLWADPGLRITTGRGPDGGPRTGVWDARLAGMWVDAPVEGCVLAGIYWHEPGSATPVPPPPAGPPARDDADD